MKLWKKALSCVLAFALIICLLPTVALAAQNAAALTLNGGKTSLSDGTWILSGGECTVSGAAGSEEALIVRGDATLTLDSATIRRTTTDKSRYAPAVSIESGHVQLILKGDSTVEGSPGYAGIYVAEGATLTISGDGTLTATGGDGAAGIGGNENGDDDEIIVGDIIITGGTVTAIGGDEVDLGCGAGIGGGTNTEGGNITITGGTVFAQGGKTDGPRGAAGIGGGDNGSVCCVTISGGNITAKAGGAAAGIGGGTDTSYADIHWGDTDGVVSEGKYGVISISGADTVVRSYGGSASSKYSGEYGGAGIGAGYPTANDKRSVAFRISIQNNAAVYAYGGYHAQAIGYGYRPNGESYYTGYGIELTIDDTITLWAQSQDDAQPALVKKITDETPVTYSSSNGTYLVSYTKEDGTAADTAAGYAALPGGDITDLPFAWDASTLTINDTVIGAAAPEGAVGNWATLYKSASQTDDDGRWQAAVIVCLLNRDDHYAYIQGYADGTVRPENNITRAEAAAIFYRLLSADHRQSMYSETNSFSDVHRGDWYNTAVSTLAGAGILSGYPDGTFRPNAPITRAEFAAIVTRVAETAGSGAAAFSDVPQSHWAYEAVCLARALGWINGYPDGSFRPDASITRAETIALVNRVLERRADRNAMLPGMTCFRDNSPDAWYYEDVQEAANSHSYTRLYGQRGGTWIESWTDLLPE